jgi:hypothetical protein
MNTSVSVFNQYYFAFLKKLKDNARIKKDSDKSSRNLLRAIKNHYMNYNQDSDDYIKFYIEQTSAHTIPLDAEKFTEWFDEDAIQSLEIYKDINNKTIEKVLNNITFFREYYVILNIFGDDSLTEEETASVVDVLKKNKKVDEFDGSDKIKAKLQLLSDLQKTDEIQDQDQDSFKELEDTSLGRLAKEIIGELDLNELNNSLNGEDDILKALANPEGTLPKLLGTVSQKMIQKMAAGELNQAVLLEDAMKFSSKMQSMPGMQGMPGGFGDLSGMMSKVQEMAAAFSGEGSASGGEMNMGSLQNMIQTMAGSMGGGGGGGGGGRGATPVINTNAVNRVEKAKQLRRKLEKKRAKENVQRKVEDES